MPQPSSPGRDGPPFSSGYRSSCLVLIADGFAGGSESLSAASVQLCALEALRCTPLWVHLRDHGVGADVFAETARPFVERLRSVRPGVPLSINTHLDLAHELGVGIHLGRRGPTLREVRRRSPYALLTASVHSAEEAREAVAHGAQAVFFSPVFPTRSKPGHGGVGLEALAACCHAVPRTPVVALGGITPERVRPCLEAGARSVAVLSGILHADRPAEAAAHYHAQLRPRP